MGKKKDVIQYIAIIVMSVITALGVYYIVPRLVHKVMIFSDRSEYNVSEAYEQVQLYDENKENHTVVQEITPSYDYLTAIEIRCFKAGNILSGTLFFEVWNDTLGKCIENGRKEVLVISAGEYTRFVFKNPLKVKKDNKYSIRFTTDISKEDGTLSLASVAADEDMSLRDGQPIKQGMNYVLRGYNSGCSYKNLFLIILIVLSAITGVALVNCRKHIMFDNINYIDIAAVVIALLSFSLLFNQGWDVAVTIHHSRDLLSSIRNGNAGQFYTMVLEKALSGGYGEADIRYAAVYNISMYLLLMLCMLPLWGIERLASLSLDDNVQIIYVNFILIGLLLLSALLIFKIMREMKADTSLAKKAVYLYISSYMVLYSSIGFCQLDLFYMIFVELGILMYLKKRYYLFSLAMSFAIMLKVFPVIIFIPLILLFEKRIIHIIKYAAIGMIFPIMTKFITYGDVGMSYSSKQLGNRYGFVNRLFANGINVGIGFGALFIIIVVVIYIWCFDHNYIEEDQWKYVICIPMIIFSVFYIFIYWHPQWLTMIMPFLIMGCAVIERRSILYCEWAIGIIVSIIAIIVYPQNVDNYMVNYGIMPLITGHKYNGISLSSAIQEIHPNLFVLLSSLLVALIFYSCYTVVNDIRAMNNPVDNIEKSSYRGVVYLRVISVYIFCIIILLPYFYLG